MRLAILASALVSVSATTRAQSSLTPAEWREDLLHLQRTVHEDYPFLFRKTSPEAFDASAQQLHDAIPELEQHEIVLGLARLVSSFGYGHTRLAWEASPVQLDSVPLNLYWFQDGVFVEGAHDPHHDLLGARVLRVEGLPVEDALARIRPLVPAENDQFFKAYGMGLVLMPAALHAQGVTPEHKRGVTLELALDGKTFERTLEASNRGRGPRRYGFIEPAGGWKAAREDAPPPLYYRNLEQDLRGGVPRGPRHDVRPSQPDPGRPGRGHPRVLRQGLHGHRGAGDRPPRAGPEAQRRREQLQEQADRHGHPAVADQPPPGTCSWSWAVGPSRACQNLVNELDNYTDAIFVGEPTAENVNFYGDTRRVDLPNSKTPVYLSFAWWQDKPQWENADWLAPDIPVALTFEDYRTNRDPVLEAILATSGEGFVPDPARHLQALVSRERLEDFLAEVERLRADPRHSFFDFEAEVNRAGYAFLGRGDVDPALSVLRLNARLFPSSANCWDSLGEACLAAGDKKAAVANYQKALALDPEGRIGQNSREMLERIELDDE